MDFESHKIEIVETCYRLITIFNSSSTIDKVEMNILGYFPECYKDLRKKTDLCINKINQEDVDKTFYSIWIKDKMNYITWMRDILMKNE
jgi:hypothetical protein